MIQRVLVANRGEIAVRVMRTCRELGISTVAVYSEPDRVALHTVYATEAYPIGPAPSRESYLDIERIIGVAQKAGADAIHPGYGFLSERADFAEACAAAGITFIGPSAHAIRTMGDRAAARRAMIAAGVPVVPEDQLERPRHIEVQIFGDQHGDIVHLGERECSIQRRHEKVIEESPSPFVDVELRARLGEVAVRAARAVDYVGAGTVEFLVDADRSFYFLGMKTRLQVEHPVTELTTGFDLVKEQLAVAEGRPLSVRTLEPRGHAIQARIYAESPERGFAPSPGRISHIRMPGGFGVRVDTGVYAGYEVTPHYDPLITKLIVSAEDRATAIRRLDRALSEYVVNGVDTNVVFLRRVVQHPAFLAGETQTDFIDRHIREADVPGEDRVKVAMIAAAIRQFEYGRELAEKLVSAPGGPREGEVSRWRQLGRLDALRRGV